MCGGYVTTEKFSLPTTPLTLNESVIDFEITKTNLPIVCKTGKIFV
jgi:hypothetical protein